MNDLATLMGQPKLIVVGTRRLWLYPQTLRTLGRFQAWLDTTTLDPDTSICRNHALLPPDAARYLMERGASRADRRRPLIGSKEAEDIAYSMEGICELLYLSVRRGRKFSRDAARTLYWSLTDAHKRTIAGTIWCGIDQTVIRTGGIMGDDSGPRRPIDWWALINRISNDPIWMPWRDIQNLTWAQILCVTGDGRLGGRESALEARARRMEEENLGVWEQP